MEYKRMMDTTVFYYETPKQTFNKWPFPTKINNIRLSNKKMSNHPSSAGNILVFELCINWNNIVD